MLVPSTTAADISRPRHFWRGRQTSGADACGFAPLLELGDVRLLRLSSALLLFQLGVERRALLGVLAHVAETTGFMRHARDDHHREPVEKEPHGDPEVAVTTAPLCEHPGVPHRPR